MAKRPDLNSDFSQKLLGDIRRRKEKLGFGSSNNQADCHKSFRGSRETTKNNNLLPQNNITIVKPNNNKGFSSPRRNNKQQITPKTSSQEIIPFRKDKNPVRDKIDVSMALALALSKTGKLQNIELLSRTKVGTDFVTQRGSIQFSNSNRQFVPNGSQYLFLPEIGIEKLNEMINAYTRNRNFKDLEECLNMLIMMQDAQDYIVGSTSSSNNNKVLLLKDKEENENESRNKSKNKNKLEKGLNSQRISVNHVVNTKQRNNLLELTSYDKSNCTNSNNLSSECNNKRMPSLVARLMGLEELPQLVKPNVEIKEVETKNEISHEKKMKNGDISRITTKSSSKCETKLERITRSYIDDTRGYFGKNAKNKEKSKPKKIEEKARVVKPTVDMKLRNKYDSYLNNRDKKNTKLAPRKVVKFECVDKDLGKNGSNSISSQKKKNSSKISSNKINNTNNNKSLENGCKIDEKIIEIDQNLKEIKKKIEEEFESKLVNFKENNEKKVANKEKNNKNGEKIIEIEENLKEIRKKTEEEFEFKLENFKEINVAKDANNEINSSNDQTLNTETLNNGEEMDQNLKEMKKKIEEQFEAKSDNFEENNVEKYTNNETRTPDEQVLKTETLNNNGDKVIEIDQNSKEVKKKIELEAKLENFEENNAEKDFNNETETSDDQIFNTETIDSIDLTSMVVDAQQMIQVPFLNEQELKVHDLKDEQIDLCNYINEPRNLFSDEHLLKEDQIFNTETTSCNMYTDAHQIIKFPSLKEELKLQDSINDQIDSCKYYIKESKNLYSDEDLLNKDQIVLKEILLKDDEVLHLAEKIFKFENPLDTPPFKKITETPLEKENNTNTVLLHTVHEILKRKGEKHDLICAYLKFQNLNSLFKELNSDLKNLEYNFDCEFIENLQQMLEREIEGRNSDSNCMWELGWNSKYFARFEKFELAKDLEKHLVGSLITELTKDLIEDIVSI